MEEHLSCCILTWIVGLLNMGYTYTGKSLTFMVIYGDQCMIDS